MPSDEMPTSSGSASIAWIDAAVRTIAPTSLANVAGASLDQTPRDSQSAASPAHRQTAYLVTMTLLSGVRVLDLTTARAELAGRMLAELGAEVLKLEPPGGRRGAPHRAVRRGRATARRCTGPTVGMGKHSAVLDIETPEPETVRPAGATRRRADRVVRARRTRSAGAGLRGAERAQPAPGLRLRLAVRAVEGRRRTGRRPT